MLYLKKRCKRIAAFIAAVIILAPLAGRPAVFAAETEPEAKPLIVKAQYLGVENYGAPETNKDNIASFRYCFLVDGEEWVLLIDNGEPGPDGKYEYPIQNILKRGYWYEIKIINGTVVSAAELSADGDGGQAAQKAQADEQETGQAAVSGTPGKRTLKNLLATALSPMGTALYIYGGGWDWQDEKEGPQTKRIGISEDWIRFFDGQDENYTYKEPDDDPALKDPSNSYYPYGRFNEYYFAGLDCSAYVGWVLYNITNTEDGNEGYVGRAKDFAKKLESYGWGKVTREIMDENGLTLKPGDIVSNRGHVWLVIGTCSDGSAVFAHSVQSLSRTGQPGGGVQLSALAWVEDCEAMKLAAAYMERQCPEWSRRYPVYLKSPDVYLNFDDNPDSGCFRWSLDGENGSITDPDGYASMTAGEILEDLLSGF